VITGVNILQTPFTPTISQLTLLQALAFWAREPLCENKTQQDMEFPCPVYLKTG
jgi:hypothetical protein